MTDRLLIRAAEEKDVNAPPGILPRRGQIHVRPVEGEIRIVPTRSPLGAGQSPHDESRGMLIHAAVVLSPVVIQIIR